MELKNIKILRLEQPNGNGVVYTKDALENALSELTAPVLGGLGLPTGCGGTVDRENVTHQVKNLRIEENYVVGDIEIFTTSKGEELLALVDAGVTDKFRFRPSGIGTLNENKVVDYNMLSVDLLSDPADNDY